MTQVRPQPKSKTSKGAESRERILEAATALFSTSGYNGTSLEAIATAAGLTQPGLLHHFQSKHALLLEILRRRDEEDLTTAVHAGGLGVIDSMREVVHANVGKEALVRLYTVMVAEGLDPSHPAHDWVVSRYSRTIRAMADALESGGVADSGSGVDLTMIPSLLIAMSDGLQIQWLVDPDFDLAGAFDLFADALESFVRSAQTRTNG